jgi:hypothetical protein
MNITAIEARDIRRVDGKDCTDAYACVSLVRDPQLMQQHHFLLLDHYVGGSGGGPEFMMLPPQHSTRVVNGGAGDPKWGDGCSIRETHPGIAGIESMHREARLSASTQRSPLSGEPTLLLLTVHDYSAGDAGFSGRVLIPQISRMQPVDQWFMLQVCVRFMYVCTCACMYVLCMYVHVHVCMYACNRTACGSVVYATGMCHVCVCVSCMHVFACVISVCACHVCVLLCAPYLCVSVLTCAMRMGRLQPVGQWFTLQVFMPCMYVYTHVCIYIHV